MPPFVAVNIPVTIAPEVFAVTLAVSPESVNDDALAEPHVTDEPEPPLFNTCPDVP